MFALLLTGLLVLLPSFCSATAFLEDGKEFVYAGEMYQNSGTMDYQPSAAAAAWKYKIRDSLITFQGDLVFGQVVCCLPQLRDKR